MKKFAVFDIDGTIGRNALFLQTVDELIAAGHLPRELRARLDEKLEAYRLRKHHNAYQEYQETSVEILFKNMAGLQVTDYRHAMDKVLSRSRGYIYVYTRDLIQELKSKDYFLIAISGSEHYTVKQFADHYGFDVAIGEVYEEKDGSFTGHIQEVYDKKDKLLQQILDEHGLTHKGSVGVGDSGSDIPMLEMTEQPIAFNPEQRLLAKAQKEGWKVVVERKNVIYELESKDGHYVLAQTNSR